MVVAEWTGPCHSVVPLLLLLSFHYLLPLLLQVLHDQDLHDVGRHASGASGHDAAVDEALDIKYRPAPSVYSDLHVLDWP